MKNVGVVSPNLPELTMLLAERHELQNTSGYETAVSLHRSHSLGKLGISPLLLGYEFTRHTSFPAFSFASIRV